MTVQIINGQPGIVEVDLTLNLLTRTIDGEVVEQRAPTPEEQSMAELPTTPQTVRNMMAAVDQLILNDLLDL